MHHNMQKRVLVVDDDDMNLMRTKRILGIEYDVFFASSGIEALDTLKREPMDLVLLDIEMPKMNGFETVCRRDPRNLFDCIGTGRRCGQRNPAGRGKLPEKALSPAGTAQQGRSGA